MTIDRRLDRQPRCAAALLSRALTIALVCTIFATAVGHITEDRFGAFEHAGWLDDYARLKDLIALYYPGLDWAVTEGGLDLYRLDHKTRRLLEDAESPEEAEGILRDFAGAFHDGHLRLARPGTDPVDPAPPRFAETLSTSTSGTEACDILGYSDRESRDRGLDFSKTAWFHPLETEGTFAAGTIVADRRTTLGLIRIPSFQPTFYGRTCASEWERFRKTLRSTCESACRNEFAWAMVGRLEDEFGTRIGQLRDLGAEALVIDLRGNNGGQGVLEAGVEGLLADSDLPPTPIAVAPSAWMAGVLAGQRAYIERALARCPSSWPGRRGLEAAFRSFDAASTEAAIPCDRRDVWIDWGARASCSNLIPLQTLSGDVSADVNSAVGPRSGAQLLSSRLTPARPHWHGPLIFLTDRVTASAAELLAGRLQDYAGAIVVGRRTAGSGGGWNFGSVHWTLEASGLEVLIPDHESFRRDGASYQAGVRPDIFEPFERGDSDAARAGALVVGLHWALRSFPELNGSAEGVSR